MTARENSGGKTSSFLNWSGQKDWVHGLAEFLRGTTHAEAVLWDHERTRLSVATLGQVDEQELRRRLEETLRNVARRQQAGPAREASLPRGFRIHTLPGETLLERDRPCLTGTTLWTWREIPWPDPKEAAVGHEEEDWRHLALLAGLCGGLGIAGWSVSLWAEAPVWLSPALYLLAMLAGGWDAGREAWVKLPKGHLDIHFLMIAVAVGATLIGAYGEAVLLLFLFSTAGALEHFALHRTRREIHALFRLAPKTARIRKPGEASETVLPVEEVTTGDVVVLRPGDTIPVDGEVLSGETATDESSLTGEAHPVGKSTGDRVYSGTLNLWGAVDIRCRHPASESSLQKVIRLIQKAQHMRAPSQRFTDRFGPRYTVGILVATSIMFFVWWLGFGIDPFLNRMEDGQLRYSAFYRAMTLLVVASPCALVLSIPSAILAAIAWGARHGILFRGGSALEKLAEVDVVALDKTGTLTTGELEVVSIESFPPGRETEVAEMAFAVEQSSSHPIARAIVRYGNAQGLRAFSMDGFRSLTGQGVMGMVGKEHCLLGRRELLREGPFQEWIDALPPPPPDLSEVWFLQGDLMGRLLLRDRIRSESADVLKALLKEGLKSIMLTGDNRPNALAVAAQLGLDEVRAGLSPEEKLQAVDELTRQGHRVAMVGDGINDAPCLAAAHVSVAMGARGSDAALEQSEVVLMHDRIENFLEALQLSRRTRRVIHQNLFVALGTIIVMVSAAVFGLVPITVGVIAHEGSTVLVCLNSLRLLGLPRAKVRKPLPSPDPSTSRETG